MYSRQRVVRVVFGARFIHRDYVEVEPYSLSRRPYSDFNTGLAFEDEVRSLMGKVNCWLIKWL
jgi:hypothetical protein